MSQAQSFQLSKGRGVNEGRLSAGHLGPVNARFVGGMRPYCATALAMTAKNDTTTAAALPNATIMRRSATDF
jgi:hypothetical protein